MSMLPSMWVCSLCDAPGACELCETCAEHCAAQRPNDIAAHRKFDAIIASTDPKRRPS